MSDTIEVYELKWVSTSIELDQYCDGLWENNNSIAIHWPLFCKNYLKDENAKLKKNYTKQFYILYDDDDNIQPITFNYYFLNDLIFKENPWKNLKIGKIYTTIEPF